MEGDGEKSLRKVSRHSECHQLPRFCGHPPPFVNGEDADRGGRCWVAKKFLTVRYLLNRRTGKGAQTGVVADDQQRRLLALPNRVPNLLNLGVVEIRCVSNLIGTG